MADADTTVKLSLIEAPSGQTTCVRGTTRRAGLPDGTVRHARAANRRGLDAGAGAARTPVRIAAKRAWASRQRGRYGLALLSMPDSSACIRWRVQRPPFQLAFISCPDSDTHK